MVFVVLYFGIYMLLFDLLVLFQPFKLSDVLPNLLAAMQWKCIVGYFL